MSKILIINLNSGHDVITSSHSISGIKAVNPHAEIEILTNKELYPIASIIAGVQKIHTIDTQLINSIYNNQLYSNAFALNAFAESLQEVFNTEWDEVINYSNDFVASYLASAVNTKSIIGTFINNNGGVQGSNTWAIYQNYVASKQARHPIDKISLRNEMIGVEKQSDTLKIKQDESYSVVAGQNFRKIREMKGSPATFVVGINLENSQEGYSLNIDTYIDVIEAIEDSKDYKVVLLLNGKSYQRAIANELNSHFNNSLISINIDMVALPSVITNLDAIISLSNNTLAIADTLESKCIEIRDYNSINQSAFAMNPENYLIYCKDELSLASDILLALNEEFGTELPIERMQSSNPVHKTVEDNYGQFCTQIRGDLDIKAELEYHLSRSFFYEVFGATRNNELLAHIKENTDNELLMNFVTEVKSELTLTVKSLLATLRSLKGVKNSENNLNNFISHLDELIQVSKKPGIAGDIVKLFEGKIENINSNDVDSNIKAIEAYLFELKSELQIITNYLSELVKPVENRVSRPSELEA